MRVFNRKDRRDHTDFEGNFSPLAQMHGIRRDAEGKCLQGPEFLPLITQNNADGSPEPLTGAHGVNGAGNFSPLMSQMGPEMGGGCEGLKSRLESRFFGRTCLTLIRLDKP